MLFCVLKLLFMILSMYFFILNLFLWHFTQSCTYNYYILYIYFTIFQSTDNSMISMPKETINDTNRNPEITYGIDDVPPWYLCLFMALQVLNIKYVFFPFIIIFFFVLTSKKNYDYLKYMYYRFRVSKSTAREYLKKKEWK